MINVKLSLAKHKNTNMGKMLISTMAFILIDKHCTFAML
jgi:hypothetical protein